ncbi:hypothetical protein [Sphingomonas sp.]|uniref:hypothetical protein n=1 Tax=Sphingomonas sp. TaxID=28214 RepID=UPI0031D70131
MLLSLLLASALSVAAKDTVAPAAPVTQVGAPVAAAAVPGRAPVRYCVITELTGSRLSRKICHTADEWIALEGAVPTPRGTAR